MAATLKTFLEHQAAAIAAQIATARARIGKVDMPSADDTERAIEEILASIDFAAWTTLAGDVEPDIAAFTDKTSVDVLLRLGIDTEARAEVLNVVSADALAYARARSAAMVGMRVDELGNLIPNPNAQWQITEGTRELLRGDVRQALEEGWSNDKLAAQLAENYAFSAERAMVIARTETQMASQAGALNGYRASGVVDGKQWLTAEDDKVSDECQANGEAGPNGDGVLRDWDAAYPSGDVAPPAHPNCRCQILPWFDDSKTPATVAETEGAEA